MKEHKHTGIHTRMDMNEITPQKLLIKPRKLALTPENRHIWDKENYNPKKKEFSPTFESQTMAKKLNSTPSKGAGSRKGRGVESEVPAKEKAPIPLADITTAYRFREPRPLKARRRTNEWLVVQKHSEMDKENNPYCNIEKKKDVKEVPSIKPIRM